MQQLNMCHVVVHASATGQSLKPERQAAVKKNDAPNLKIRWMGILSWSAEELLVDACQIFSKLPHLGDAVPTICKVLMAKRLIQDDVTCIFLRTLHGLHTHLSKYNAR